MQSLVLSMCASRWMLQTQRHTHLCVLQSVSDSYSLVCQLAVSASTSCSRSAISRWGRNPLRFAGMGTQVQSLICQQAVSTSKLGIADYPDSLSGPYRARVPSPTRLTLLACDDRSPAGFPIPAPCFQAVLSPLPCPLFLAMLLAAQLPLQWAQQGVACSSHLPASIPGQQPSPEHPSAVHAMKSLTKRLKRF